MIPPPNGDGKQPKSLNEVLKPIRRMGCLTLFITVGFGYSGLDHWLSWFRELLDHQSWIEPSSVPYSHPIDAIVGLVFCCAAVMLLWFTFRIPELRQDYRGMGVAWSLILAGWGTLRLLSVLFGMTSHQLTLLVNPVGGSGRLLFAAWLLWWYYRAESAPAPRHPDHARSETENGTP